MQSFHYSFLPFLAASLEVMKAQLTFVLSECIRSERCKANLVFRGFFSNSCTHVVTSIHFLLMTFLYTIPTELKRDQFRLFILFFSTNLKKKKRRGTPINSKIPKWVKKQTLAIVARADLQNCRGNFQCLSHPRWLIKISQSGKGVWAVSAPHWWITQALKKDGSQSFCLLLMHSLVLVLKRADFTAPLNVFVFSWVWHNLTYTQTQSLEAGSAFCLIFPQLHLPPFDKVRSRVSSKPFANGVNYFLALNIQTRIYFNAIISMCGANMNMIKWLL